MKFKRGQLAEARGHRLAQPRASHGPCIVLEYAPDVAEKLPVRLTGVSDVYYKVYMIRDLQIAYLSEDFLSPSRPQEAQNEV